MPPARLKKIIKESQKHFNFREFITNFKNKKGYKNMINMNNDKPENNSEYVIVGNFGVDDSECDGDDIDWDDSDFDDDFEIDDIFNLDENDWEDEFGDESDGDFDDDENWISDSGDWND